MSAGPVLIMAGGTGGHIFPGIAVARELLARGERVLWLGSLGGLESRIVPAAGLPFEGVAIGGVRGKGWTTRLAAPFRLLRAILAQGSEIGSHSYTHPNLAQVSPEGARIELNSTQRLIEAYTGRSVRLFRAPYFGDAEPTTRDALGPIAIANALGYLTSGIHVDAEDWRESNPRQIVRNVLDERHKGNVVLLHDGGGDRSGTVAALGPMIDSLRARGDTLVLLSELAGITRDEAMPTLPPAGATTRLIELATYGIIGGTQQLFFDIFILVGYFLDIFIIELFLIIPVSISFGFLFCIE